MTERRRRWWRYNVACVCSEVSPAYQETREVAMGVLASDSAYSPDPEYNMMTSSLWRFKVIPGREKRQEINCPPTHPPIVGCGFRVVPWPSQLQALWTRRSLSSQHPRRYRAGRGWANVCSWGRSDAASPTGSRSRRPAPAAPRPAWVRNAQWGGGGLEWGFITQHQTCRDGLAPSNAGVASW